MSVEARKKAMGRRKRDGGRTSWLARGLGDAEGGQLRLGSVQRTKGRRRQLPGGWCFGGGEKRRQASVRAGASAGKDATRESGTDDRADGHTRSRFVARLANQCLSKRRVGGPQVRRGSRAEVCKHNKRGLPGSARGRENEKRWRLLVLCFLLECAE